MKTQTSPLLKDHLNTIFTYEQQLHQMIPSLLQKSQDEKLQTALTDLLQLTMHNSQRLGQLSLLMDTELQQQKSQAVQALITELQTKSHRDTTATEQTHLLSLLHKYLGHIFTDYTYALNLVENRDEEGDQALELLRKSLDELKATNNRLSSLADKTIREIKEQRRKAEKERLEQEQTPYTQQVKEVQREHQATTPEASENEAASEVGTEPKTAEPEASVHQQQVIENTPKRQARPGLLHQAKKSLENLRVKLA